MRRHCLEVFYGFCVDVDCDLLLQPFRIWVLLGSAEIIFFSHVNHLIPIVIRRIFPQFLSLFSQI